MIECEATCPPRLLDLSETIALCERNTFLNVQPPPQLELCKASSEPGTLSRDAGDFQLQSEEASGTEPIAGLPLLPPPPLELEAFETYDSFDDPQEHTPSLWNIPDEAASSAPPAVSTASMDCQWRSEVDNRFQSPFLTLPENASDECRANPTSEGSIVFEWQDCVHQLPRSSSASASYIMQGAFPLAAATLADFSLPLLPAARVPPPPSLPAPCVGAPSEPPNMIAAPVDGASQSELEAPASDVSSLELTRQASGITCTVLGSIHHISWQVDAKKLESQDKQAVSPQFIIDLPELGPQPFKIALYPKIVTDGKRGASFKKAKGRGKVLLKCEAQLPPDIPDIGFRIGIGRGDKLHKPRGPVAHNFSEQSMRGLAKNEEEWDFHAAVDESGTFVVSLVLAPSVTMLTPPHSTWWHGQIV